MAGRRREANHAASSAHATIHAIGVVHGLGERRRSLAGAGRLAPSGRVDVILVAHGVPSWVDAEGLEVRKGERVDRNASRGRGALPSSGSGSVDGVDEVGNGLLARRERNRKGVVSNGSAARASSRSGMW